MNYPLMAIALAATAITPLAAQNARQGNIAIENPWSRQTAPGQGNGAGFMTIVNRGKAADRLLGGTSLAAARVEVHSMTMDGGVMRMRPVTGGLPIPAGGGVALKPGGYHIMLIGLKQPLAPGAQVPVTLRFENAGAIAVRLKVQPIGATGAEASHGRH
ncbi:copper chaperone PCu(A)C [Sphingomonas colocasiae]|uniref:Copper chaperone PCu(A)C n=1 Tax=Sphingomonas colocasiae TaxID=1848973 RepID=A0ABS7PUP9_9SPHN|nr:copper chaperone PCu(A)C [Sphingomonas colocasiae]MBY8824991.1 copper chaperone PCu(A)C [Sphingomonas colocasiae]